MDFRTQIAIPKHNDIDLDCRIMLLGSCFADNIGTKLHDFRFACDVNPFGVLYNPLSIAQSIERLLTEKPFTEDELFCHNALWHSWMHHGSFSDTTPAHTLDRINQRYLPACANMSHTDVLMLTFGSSWVYEYDGQVVANCHKVPNNRFVRRRLTIDEITDRYTHLFTQLWQHNPTLRIILTVSPVRYMRGAIPENQTNKAILLLATEALSHTFADRVSYFPAYEIVLDELRDYRFFADDMIHPSGMATAYVWERFVQTYLTPAAQAQLPQIDKENKRAAHHPLH